MNFEKVIASLRKEVNEHTNDCRTFLEAKRVDVAISHQITANILHGIANALEAGLEEGDQVSARGEASQANDKGEQK